MLWRKEEIPYTLPCYLASIPYLPFLMSNLILIYLPLLLPISLWWIGLALLYVLYTNRGFFKTASTELEHVVWPTPAENKKYMIYTIGVIVVIGIFLAILGYAVTNGLRLARAQFPHDTISTTVSGEDTVSQSELDKILQNIKTNTGRTASGTNLMNWTGITTNSGSR